MEIEATASGETMEDVLRGLHFEPMESCDERVLWSWRDRESGVAVRQMRDGTSLAWCGIRSERNPSPAHLRRIVAAEVACAAAWRGEEAGTETKET